VFASRTSESVIDTTETLQFIDMTDMSVSISINVTSDILILVSITAMADFDDRIYIRALVDNEVADPSMLFLTPLVFGTDYESYAMGWAAYSFNFHKASIEPGTHVVKIQWQVDWSVGSIADRSLIVLALPTK